MPNGKFFTGIGSTLIIFVLDQHGKEMRGVTIKESVTSPNREVGQNPNPVGVDANGNFTDLVSYGDTSDEMILSQDVIKTFQELVENPTTRRTTQTLEISMGGTVLATAQYDRVLSNVDKNGNLRNYVNPENGRGMVIYTISISEIRFKSKQ
jgi:hypothetical protein